MCCVESPLVQWTHEELHRGSAKPDVWTIGALVDATGPRKTATHGWISIVWKGLRGMVERLRVLRVRGVRHRRTRDLLWGCGGTPNW